VVSLDGHSDGLHGHRLGVAAQVEFGSNV
jgi:hypothetical protein